MTNQPKEHTEKSLPIKQTTIQNYRKTYGEEEPERKKERRRRGRRSGRRKGRQRKKTERVERLTKAEQGREKRWRGDFLLGKMRRESRDER